MELFIEILINQFQNDFPIFLKVCGIMVVATFAAYKFALKRGL
ncbi:hypothetical protein [Arcobacter sp. FWKO B]|nr:hypothetical protein [Arcobacter sp. FWKO B]